MGGMTYLIGYGIEAIKDGTTGSHINHDHAEDQSGRGFNQYEQYQSHGYGALMYAVMVMAANIPL